MGGGKLVYTDNPILRESYVGGWGTQVPRMRVCLVGTFERQQGLQVCGAERERESSEMLPQR